MESLTYFKNLKITPKKMRFLLPEIKKYKPAQALEHLMYSPYRSGKIFYQVLHSAIANAKSSLKVSEDMLKFKVLTVEAGQALKRYLPNARGSVRPFKRRYCHVKMILTAAKQVQTPVKKEMKEEIKAKSEVKSQKKALKAGKNDKKTT